MQVLSDKQKENSFITRPIFASVLSILIFIAGLIAIFRLPISEYPQVAPPSVVINASFPGANPKIISQTVAAPLEEQINGVENMLYMKSLANSNGGLSITVTFEIGTDPDLAQQMVQNRVSRALPRLPEITRQLGVTVVKSSNDLTMVAHIISPDNRYDELYLRNYAALNIKDQLSKIKGVGEVAIFGSGEYAMRIWLDPNKISQRNMTALEVVNAIRQQNVQVAAGVIGGPPYSDNKALNQLPLNVKGRLETVEEFENIIIKRDQQGTVTKLQDVARVELDSQNYSIRSMLNNKKAVGMGIFAMSGSNALQIASDVRSTMAKLKENFPEGVDFNIVYDPTVFVKNSINSVITTLLEAVMLVVLVVIVFLQTWRASIIPLLAVPVSIVGTFAFMLIFGFSINVLTLFGLILAIGIVVDDAIVVVENVERNIRDGKKPLQATQIAMREVRGPIIATSLVVAAVFVPIAFISGLTGMFYKQFAITIVIATFISTFNSLTLSPALCALLLKSKDAKKDFITRKIDKIFGRFFNWFNNLFHKSRDNYANFVGFSIGRKSLMLTIFAILLICTNFSFKLLQSGFIPPQDKGYLISFAQLPAGSNLDQTTKVIKEMSKMAFEEEGVRGAVSFPGLSINGFTSSSSAGIVFVPLKDFNKRKGENLSAGAISQKLQAKYNTIPNAFVQIFPPPPVRGLGNTGGFKLQIQDRSGQGYEALNNVVQNIINKSYQSPKLSGVWSSFNINVPQLYANLDRQKAQNLGIPINNIFDTLQIYLGSLYVNDFNKFGKTYQVIVQADSNYRAKPQDIGNLRTKNSKGEMVPLASVIKIEDSSGPEMATRYNAFNAADINGNPAAGFSSGDAQKEITNILKDNLPKGFDFEWTQLTYQQILAGNTAIYIFPLCLLLVFLVLSAQYESLFLPIAVILTVPLAVLSAIIGVYLFGGDNNIFTQISLFVLAGLASKNAILIVEFSRDLEKAGYGVMRSTIEASRLRLRPILMTSLAFILGVSPLVFSQGAGAEMRQAIGYAVFCGMIGVTIFGLILTPTFYVIMRKLEIYFTKKPKNEN